MCSHTVDDVPKLCNSLTSDSFTVYPSLLFTLVHITFTNQKLYNNSSCCTLHWNTFTNITLHTWKVIGKSIVLIILNRHCLLLSVLRKYLEYYLTCSPEIGMMYAARFLLSISCRSPSTLRTNKDLINNVWLLQVNKYRGSIIAKFCCVLVVQKYRSNSKIFLTTKRDFKESTDLVVVLTLMSGWVALASQWLLSSNVTFPTTALLRLRLTPVNTKLHYICFPCDWS